MSRRLEDGPVHFRVFVRQGQFSLLIHGSRSCHRYGLVILASGGHPWRHSPVVSVPVFLGDLCPSPPKKLLVGKSNLGFIFHTLLVLWSQKRACQTHAAPFPPGGS